MEVIIVDDDEITVYLHKVFVKDSKFHTEPQIFYDATSMLNYLAENYKRKEAYCLFLDLSMPLMDGWQLLEALQKLEMVDNIHVVILTSSPDTKDRLKAFTYPQVIEYLEKPLNEEKLTLLKECAYLKNYFCKDSA